MLFRFRKYARYTSVLFIRHRTTSAVARQREIEMEKEKDPKNKRNRKKC